MLFFGLIRAALGYKFEATSDPPGGKDSNDDSGVTEGGSRKMD